MSKGRFIRKWKNHTKDTWVKRTYRIWCGMRARCYHPQSTGYADYGGRGITVCERWRNDFDTFVTDMGFAPDGRSIERIDNNQGYDPFNCIWATKKEQANNTRNNILLTIQGHTMSATQWADKVGIPATRILERIRRGWSSERAVYEDNYTAPHGGHRRYVLGCRCLVCVEGSRKRGRETYRKKNPIIKNRSKYNPNIPPRT